MWYDKYPGAPPRGTPLETLFVLVHVARKEAELLATRTLVRGQFATLAKSADAAKAAFEAYQAYADTMFPFLEMAGKMQTTDHQRLAEHVRKVARIDVKALREEQNARNRQRALQQFKAKRT